MRIHPARNKRRLRTRRNARRDSARRLLCETLEPRQLLAGEWSVLTTGDTIAEDAAGSEAIVFSLSDVQSQGAQASVIPGLQFQTASESDLQDTVQALFDAVNAYSGPGSLSYSTTNGVLTYTGGVGGTSMADLLVPIEPVNDTFVEGDESFVVTLQNPVGAGLGQSQQSITIRDDDEPPINDDHPPCVVEAVQFVTAAVQSGDWGDPNTWDNGVPDSTARAIVADGFTVTLSGASHVAGEIVVHGVLDVAESAVDKSLSARWIHVNSGGLFQVGTESDRYDESEFVLVLCGIDPTADHVIETATGTMNVDDNDGFLMAAMNGRLQFFGEEKLSFTKLGATAEVGATQITVENVIERNFIDGASDGNGDPLTSAADDGSLNWQVGDQIVIASSAHQAYEQEEVRTIVAVNDLGTQTAITLDQALNYRHYGEIETYGQTHAAGTNDPGRTWDIDMRAEVALLNRNVRIQGTAQQDTDTAFGNRLRFDTVNSIGDVVKGMGGHAMIMASAGQTTVDGVQFDLMGQTGQLGRYPIHWHLAGDRTGDLLRNSSITNSNNRGLTVHGTDNLRIEGIVLHDVHGHGFFMEDAVETGNEFIANIALGIHKVGGDVGNADPFGVDTHDEVQQQNPRFVSSAAYWITNPDNTWVGNVSAGSEGSGFWFILPDQAIGASADNPIHDGVNPSRTNIRQFAHNAAHSSIIGLTFDRGSDLGGNANRYDPTGGPAVVSHFTAYQTRTAIYHRGLEQIFDELRLADNGVGTFNTFDQVMHNSLYVGHSRGNSDIAQERSGHFLYDGPSSIVDSHFAGFGEETALTFDSVGGAAKHTEHYVSGLSFEDDGTYGNISNVTPNRLAINTFSAIYDGDGSLTTAVGGGPGSVVVSDEPFMVDSDGSDFQPAGWQAWVTDNRYAEFFVRRFDLINQTIPQTLVTTPDGDVVELVAVADSATEPGGSRSVKMPLMVESGDYTVEFPAGFDPATQEFNMRFEIRRRNNVPANASTVLIFPGIGSTITHEGGTRVYSESALRSATETSYFHAAGGDLLVHLHVDPQASFRTADVYTQLVARQEVVNVWSVGVTSEYLSEDSAGAESVVFSLSGVVDEGAQASVTLGIQDITTDPSDYQNGGAAVVQAVNDYSGPGTLTFKGETAVLTYTGGPGGTSMADLLVSIEPIDDAVFEYSESAVVSISNPVGAELGQTQQQFTILDNDGTALDRYVAKPDASYEYELIDTIVETGTTTYVIDMTSQTWRSAAEVDLPQWQHLVEIIVPDGASSDTAILFIGAGHSSGGGGSQYSDEAREVAQHTGQITVHLSNVPNQYLAFTDDGVARREDSILAYTFDKFLDGGDEEWPALLPMVKSAVRAMDTAQEFLTDNTAHTATDFFVTGGSKRGWTTYLTAAVDPRVSGLTPVVFDYVHSEPSIVFHRHVYEGVTENTVGGYAIAVQDYVNFDVMARVGTPEFDALAEVIDPYSYLDRLTQPKFVVLSTGDQFMPMASQFYINDFQGPTYLRYIPNTGHSAGRSESKGFFKAVEAGETLPTYDWTVEGANNDIIRLNSTTTPVEVNLWQATNLNSLDFRIDTFGANWNSTPLTDQGGGEYVATVAAPATGGTAFLIEMKYDVGGEILTFTTEARIVEPVAAPENEWSISTTSETINENAAGTESTIYSLSGVVAEGAMVSVQTILQDVTTDPTDYEHPVVPLVQAVNAYNGPGALAYSTTTGTLTYTGGVGGTSMTDLFVAIQPMDDSDFEYTESFEVLLTNASGATLDAAQSLVNISILDDDGTALDRYVAKPDSSYAYSHINTFFDTGVTTYLIDMTSQTWRTAAEVDKPQWEHWVQIVVPDNVVSDTAVLIISGGGNTQSAPTQANSGAVATAQETGQVTIFLSSVPSTPLTFSDVGSPLGGDSIIAYSFDKFLKGGDEEWPLLSPMVKSAVRAMDTAQEFLPAEIGHPINDFYVTGGSKRGWTTWLTAASDPRVTGIAPRSIDLLNMEASMLNHQSNYEGVTEGIIGGFAEAVGPYTQFGVFDQFGTPESDALIGIVDPYAYRDRLTMPKYILHGTGDQFFTPDSSQFYIHDLVGPTYMRYFPNTGHGVGSEATDAYHQFFSQIESGATLPTYDWTVEGASNNSIHLTTVDTPTEVNLWQATNPDSLDFRVNYFGANWTSTPLTDQGGGVYVGSVPVPATGGTAFLVEMKYNVGGEIMTFTTETRIVEPGVSRDLGPVNRGIGVDDNATGTGWILQSSEIVFARFASAPPNPFNSDHLIAVRYHVGQWQYNDNQQWRNFTPRTDDLLLASVDFSGDTIDGLEGELGQVNGINQGFSSGDLTFIANQWNGTANDGEFTIEGSQFVANEPQTTSRPLGPVGRGVGVDDDAVGTGWIMHSVASVFTRFASAPPNPHNSDQLIAVRFDAGQWQYNDNQQWRPFTPSPDDVLIADLNFGADTITSLIGQSGMSNGIHRGYVSGDLVFLADRWDGAFNNGEFTIQGTSFVINTLDGTDRSLGPINRGIGVDDNATGTGWILHSSESVFTRFAAAPPNSFNSDHLVAVRNEAGQWQYNDNQQWRDFTPTDGDVLLASVDFDGDTVTSLQGQSGLIQGIAQGFLDGDLTFIADRWNGVSNDGEFTVLGSQFRVLGS